MKNRFYITIVTFLLCQAVQSKTTYIPTYRSFIQITQNGNESVMANSYQEELELMAQDSSFCITLIHENVDKEKVKAIKRAKNAAGWMTFATFVSGFSAGFNSTYYNNALTTYIEMRRTENIAALSGFMHDVANAEQRLTIDYYIDNLSDKELMVADLVRGLTWYIPQRTSMQFSLPNPGIERLRISDLHHTSVKYADIIGGNSVNKETVEWEDDDCWIVQRCQGKNFDGGDTSFPEYYDCYYYYIKKITFESIEISREEVKEFKRAHKAEKN